MPSRPANINACLSFVDYDNPVLFIALAVALCSLKIKRLILYLYGVINKHNEFF